ncbi:hypothetical protein ACP70R_028168 [Stipagrostis hirtigluma subsp. patula]
MADLYPPPQTFLLLVAGPHAKKRKTEEIDRISDLPDAILGEIISFLPTKDGARTQTLASRWRHLWLAAPLNLELNCLPAGEQSQAAVISRILATHPGPARRLSVRAMYLLHRPAMLDAWLRSPALDSLQELEFDVLPRMPWPTLPASAFRSAALRVITISKCHLLNSVVETLRFPQLRQLELEVVNISERALHNIIAGCSVLEYLLLNGSFGFNCLRINSPSLVGIGMCSGELIIEDAPLLRRLLQFKSHMGLRKISVISAPKLETVGCLSDHGYDSELVFGATIIQKLCAVSLTVVSSVKILAIRIYLSLDMVINLMRCFPCLEMLYIESCVSKDRNLWRRKHRNIMSCFDIRLKTIVLKNYRGTKSQVNFTSFFVMNAKRLELMRFEGEVHNDDPIFMAEHLKLLQLDNRASRCAQLSFTNVRRCLHNLTHIKHVRDLSITNPFECTC